MILVSMRKCLFFLLLCSNGYAAFNGLSHHSRANCVGFNETISWDMTQLHTMAVISVHFLPDNTEHKLVYKLTDTLRAHAYDVGDLQKALIAGFHYMLLGNNILLVQEDYVTDCSIYDGWWN